MKRAERVLEVRIVDGFIGKPGEMGRKITQRYVSCNIEDIRLPTPRQMQSIAYEVKMALARANRRRKDHLELELRGRRRK